MGLLDNSIKSIGKQRLHSLCICMNRLPRSFQTFIRERLRKCVILLIKKQMNDKLQPVAHDRREDRVPASFFPSSHARFSAYTRQPSRILRGGFCLFAQPQASGRGLEVKTRCAKRMPQTQRAVENTKFCCTKIYADTFQSATSAHMLMA